MMKQFKLVLCLLALIFVFGSMAKAQEKSGERLEVELDTTVVTATKTEHTLADVPEATIVITREEIEAQNATNVLEVLRWIPGIRPSAAYGAMGGDKYIIDGSPSNYTLMLVDGNRVKGSYILSEMPISTIERIEIVKGANSLLYGSDALSGVINIITKRAPDRLTFDFEASYSTNEEDTNTEEVSVGFKLGKLRQLYTYGRKDVEGGEYESNSYAGKFGLDLTDKAELKFDFRVNDYDKKHTEMDRYDYLLELNWDVDERSKLKVKGFFRDYESVAHVGGAPVGTEEDSQYDEEEIQYTRLLGGSHLVTVGYQRMGDEFDYSGPHDKWSESQDTNCLYLQDEITITESLILVPAVRVDYHSEWDEELNPKLSVLWRVTDATSLRASWGMAFKAPTLTQMYRTTFHGHGTRGFWIMGNPDLEPEDSTSYRVSIEQRFGKTFLGSLALFRNDFEDMIKGGYTGKIMPDGFKEYSYSNVAEAYTQGVEVDLKLYLTDDILATLGYTYLDTENEETGEELRDAPRHRITPGLRYHNKNIGLMAEVRGEYEGKTYTREGSEESNFLLHAGLSKTITKYAKLWVNADNLLDEEEKSGISCEGITVTCGMRFTY
ncbi:MAG: outer membrane receptor for ferrienterochelin and colicins [Desulfobacteraceae bacterium Eth-SRB2]|nr:MAG: outer membrane receptor for ferrienterochelin and colicins [Desulfobacteraceae bacterium Eth-SRB2]